MDPAQMDRNRIVRTIAQMIMKMKQKKSNKTIRMQVVGIPIRMSRMQLRMQQMKKKKTQRAAKMMKTTNRWPNDMHGLEKRLSHQNEQ